MKQGGARPRPASPAWSGREKGEAIRLEKAISPFLLVVVLVGRRGEREGTLKMGWKRDTRTALARFPLQPL